jgi:hypothetical protein
MEGLWETLGFSIFRVSRAKSNNLNFLSYEFKNCYENEKFYVIGLVNEDSVDQFQTVLEGKLSRLKSGGGYCRSDFHY